MLKILIENSALQASKLYLIEWESLEFIINYVNHKIFMSEYF